MVKVNPPPDTVLTAETVRPSFSIDANNRVHRPNGQFANRQQTETVKGGLEGKLPKESKLSKSDNYEMRDGQALSKRYVHYFNCTCKVHSPHSKARVIQHLVGMSSRVDYPSASSAVGKHNRHYPDHVLLSIELMFSKEMRL